MNTNDLKFYVSTSLSGVIKMKITHVPTGLCVNGVGQTYREKLQDELMADLQVKLDKWRMAEQWRVK